MIATPKITVTAPPLPDLALGDCVTFLLPCFGGKHEATGSIAAFPLPGVVAIAYECPLPPLEQVHSIYHDTYPADGILRGTVQLPQIDVRPDCAPRSCPDRDRSTDAPSLDQQSRRLDDAADSRSDESRTADVPPPSLPARGERLGKAEAVQPCADLAAFREGKGDVLGFDAFGDLSVRLSGEVKRLQAEIDRLRSIAQKSARRRFQTAIPDPRRRDTKPAREKEATIAREEIALREPQINALKRKIDRLRASVPLKVVFAVHDRVVELRDTPSERYGTIVEFQSMQDGKEYPIVLWSVGQGAGTKSFSHPDRLHRLSFFFRVGDRVREVDTGALPKVKKHDRLIVAEVGVGNEIDPRPLRYRVQLLDQAGEPFGSLWLKEESIELVERAAQPSPRTTEVVGDVLGDVAPVFKIGGAAPALHDRVTLFWSGQAPDCMTGLAIGDAGTIELISISSLARSGGRWQKKDYPHYKVHLDKGGWLWLSAEYLQPAPPLEQDQSASSRVLGETSERLPDKPIEVPSVAVYDGQVFYSGSKYGAWRPITSDEISALKTGDRVSEQETNWVYEFVKLDGNEAICRFVDYARFRYRIELTRVQIPGSAQRQAASEIPSADSAVEPAESVAGNSADLADEFRSHSFECKRFADYLDERLHIIASQSIIDSAAKLYSADRFSEKGCIKGAIELIGKHWACMGMASTGKRGTHEVTLVALLPEGTKIDRSADNWYRGKIATCRKQSFVLGEQVALCNEAWFTQIEAQSKAKANLPTFQAGDRIEIIKPYSYQHYAVGQQGTVKRVNSSKSNITIEVALEGQHGTIPLQPEQIRVLGEVKSAAEAIEVERAAVAKTAEADITVTLRQAIDGYDWTRLKEQGATDEALMRAIADCFGIEQGGHFPHWTARGGKNPRFWNGYKNNRVKPDLQGKTLVSRVRELLEMPYPPSASCLLPSAPNLNPPIVGDLEANPLEQAVRLHDRLATLEIEISRIRAEGSIAPDHCRIEPSSPGNRKFPQVVWKSERAIFINKRTGAPAKSQYIGGRGSDAHKAAIAALERRKRLAAIMKEKQLLEEAIANHD